jgi:hypothetical protein
MMSRHSARGQTELLLSSSEDKETVNGEEATPDSVLKNISILEP